MTAPLLSVRGLTRHFGGVTASDGIDLDVFEHEAHAHHRPQRGRGRRPSSPRSRAPPSPDAGTIELDGRSITHLPAHRRARLGLARSFQITSIFATLTVIENAVLAVQAATGSCLSAVGRSPRGRRPAGSRPRPPRARGPRGAGPKTPPGISLHGEHRQLEIAMALATRPRLLLLDEPMAGMGPEESARMVSTLRDLRRERTLLLVEHDMDAVFAIADRITVLVSGRVVASGRPEAIRADPRGAPRIPRRGLSRRRRRGGYGEGGRDERIPMA